MAIDVKFQIMPKDLKQTVCQEIEENQMINLCFIILVVFFAFCPLALGVYARQSVKLSRQAVIRELRHYFGDVAHDSGIPNNNSNKNLLQSFEFVKFKYRVDTQDSRLRNDSKTLQPDFFVDEWTLAGIPLFLLLIIGNIFTGSVLLVIFCADCSNIFVPECLLLFLKSHKIYMYASLSGYVGAYTFLIRSFYQAINNFDLSPSSFFGAFNNIMFGSLFPQIIFGFFTMSSGVPDAKMPLTTGLLMITFFVGGYMPDAVLRFMLQQSVVKTFKGERSDFGEKGKTTSIEVLDGIDSFVRFRLSDFHLEAVQNLASVNPILLFVETPYGIYQMIDWVAQAQLCASVGVDCLFKLWDLGIRTIFDLERAALHPELYTNRRILFAIEKALFLKEATRRPGQMDKDLLPEPPEKWSSESIVANIRMRVDGPYTHRLRQIVNRISDQLEPSNRHLRPVTIPLPSQ